MKINELYRNIEMLSIALGVAIFALGYTYISLTLIIYLFISRPKLKFPKKGFYFLSTLLLVGVINSLIFILINENSIGFESRILLRNRFFIIRILFAFSLLLYFYKLPYNEILKFVYFMSIFHSLAAIFQLLNAPFERVTMLTTESSAAGMYYIFMAPLLLLYYKVNKQARFWISIFLVLGLFIRSKAQILVLPLLLVYFVFKSNNLILKRTIIFSLVLGLILLPLILNIKEVQDITLFLGKLKEHGIGGLTEKNKIWSSFTLRFSSFLTAIQLFYENFLGIGFGVFHPEYILRMSSSDFIQSQMTGIEISRTLSGEMYATPKSLFFDYLVSAGMFFLIPIVGVAWVFHKSEKSIFIKASLYGLLIVSMMVELAPFLAFLILLIALHYKKRKKLNHKYG